MRAAYPSPLAPTRPRGRLDTPERGEATLDGWLDRTVVFSFDATGFRRHARSFVPAPERDLRGADALVTGGTAGIGRAVVEALAGRGARVTTWARDPARGAAAAQAAGARFTAVDLGDLAAVGRAARAFAPEPLAAVVLNAGGMPLTRTSSPQGHEVIWASQVLGHLLLLRVLRRRGLLGPETRVIWVSSGGMYTVPLDLSDLRRERGYQRHTVYAVAKRAQVLLAEALAARWPEVPMAAMHPGWVDTEAVRTSMPLFHRLTRPILRTPAQGADTAVWYVGRAEAPPSGRFWFDRREVPTDLRAATVASAADREALWAVAHRDTDPFLEEP